MAFDSFGLDNYTVDNSYAIDGEANGPSYPWIQADEYRPRGLKDKISLGITADSLALIDGQLDGAVDVSTISFGDDEVEFGAFKPGVRWVVLCRPKMQAIVKDTGEIVPLRKGMKERGEVTISKLFLACIVDGDPVLNNEGTVQIFTLKLKSSKSGFVGSAREADYGVKRNNGHRTIEQLNQAIVKINKARPNQWLAHTVSVSLAAIPEKFSNGTDSSIGIRFVFEPKSNAKPLSDLAKSKIMELVTSEEFRELAADPFGLKRQQLETAAAQQDPVVEYEIVDEEGNELPF